jgi:hypothetical protein
MSFIKKKNYLTIFLITLIFIIILLFLNYIIKNFIKEKYENTFNIPLSFRKISDEEIMNQKRHEESRKDSCINELKKNIKLSFPEIDEECLDNFDKCKPEHKQRVSDINRNFNNWVLSCQEKPYPVDEFMKGFGRWSFMEWKDYLLERKQMAEMSGNGNA